MENVHTTPKETGSNLWIGVGYFFAVLGGIIGIAIGYNYRSKKYDDQTRRHGLYIIIIGSIIMAIAKVMMTSR
ncbi:hypothetical protein EJV47_04660 [Hymenobacter gummosus]|uniref:Uncharacterized protein n=1 Tax=Hymenobacter gummosus TaxID=1776032 RepID=A0A3S0JJK2_9BACT|nr:hypothetical protein [Hymenobacter gummosus]RTQ52318.1 hypothetical protein EJV47_04660 [Hymenobacter gummosus]